MEITGKVAMVSGGASGIGLAITEQLLKNGIKGVIILDINTELGEQVTSELSKKFACQKVIFHKTDVFNKISYEDAFKKAINIFGQLDIVVNNAGILNDIKYESQNNVNLTGEMHGTVLAVKYMSKENGGNGGVILSTSSLMAVGYCEVMPFYSATKAGILNLMRGYGDPVYFNKNGIRMLALLPSSTTDTNLFDHAKFNTICINNNPQKYSSHHPRPTQKPISVGCAAVYLIKHAETASAHVVEEGKLFLLNIPAWQTYATIIKENVDLE